MLRPVRVKYTRDPKDRNTMIMTVWDADGKEHVRKVSDSNNLLQVLNNAKRLDKVLGLEG